MRLIFGATLDLMPEEAYYWDYSQHLDIGYLDHPPMVAWLIWLGTKVGGNTEFSVRIGAILCWFIAAFFIFQLTRNLYGKTAAFIALMLFCVLPFFFVTGLVMTPDAPLTAAWSGGLYFLERALIGERRSAWLGVGLCVGLGMLSKYTIVLLAPPTLLLLLLDTSLRRWLWRPEPYLAVLLAGLLFSPVVYWNVLNDWASFAFQGARRLEASFDFSLHILLASILLLLTPVGLAIAIQVLWRGDRFQGAGRWLAEQRTSFIVAYTLVPLSIFIAFSLFHKVKLNWTGPLWLAVVPAIAWVLTAENSEPSRRGKLGPAWRVTVLAALLTYGAGLNYMVLGVPDLGLTHAALDPLPVAWRQFGEQADIIEKTIERTTGSEPLLVGMDRYFLSSEMAFYDPDKDGAENTAGRSLFGMDSLMFRYWFKPAEVRGRNIILFSLTSKGAIAVNSLSDRFKTLGPIQDHLVFKDGSKVGNFFYRIGYGYRAN
jgi:dolichol-phosphate mannosyltransferase